MKKILFLLALLLLPSIAAAQWQTPTNTVPVGRGSGTGFLWITKPWCDPKSKGAKGDGVADDSAAFLACQTELTPFEGGVINVTAGRYCLFTGFTLTLKQTLIQGSQGSILSACGHDTTVLKIDNGNAGVDNLVILGYNSPSASVPAFWLTANASDTSVNNVRVRYGQFPTFIQCIDCRFTELFSAYGYSTANVFIENGNWIYDAKIDQDVPVSYCPGTSSPSVWAATTAYTRGDCAVVGSYYLQATVTGTSGGVAPTVPPYDTPVVDGSVTWQLYSPGTFYGIQFDSFLPPTASFTGAIVGTALTTSATTGVIAIGQRVTDATGNIKPGTTITAGSGTSWTVSISQTVASEAMNGWTGGAGETHIFKMDLSGPYTAGMAVTNTLGGAQATLIKANGLILGGALANVYLVAGSNVSISQSEFGGCTWTSQGCSAVLVRNTWQGDSTFNGNLFLGAGLCGFKLEGGTKFIATGNTIAGAQTAAVCISANVNNWTFVANDMSASPSYGGNAACLTVAAGTSDYGTFVANNCAGLAITNGGTGTHNTISNNGIISTPLQSSSYVEFSEISDPAAAPANSGRLYVKDVGGKSALFMRFPSGATQQIAIEP